jgi:phosphatidylethanolamine/phosphatidyl-N-methylethanolamine N-methyltransferase
MHIRADPMKSGQRKATSITDLIRKRYDRLAPFYDFLEAPVERFQFSSWRNRLKDQIIGKRALEAGVGTGKNFK